MSVALMALAGGLSVPTSSTAPADLLARMGAYTQRFERSMSALIADERYEQSYSNPGELPAMTRRSLRSVVLMIRLPLDVHWLVFRDVLESDGQPVSSDRGRLERLFRDSAGSALQHAQALLRESARFNIGPVERNFNTPTLPLVFLLPENQKRIRVSGVKNERLEGREVAVVSATEVGLPTLIRAGGLDTPLLLNYWAEPATGAVVRAEARFVSPRTASRAQLRCEFAWNAREGLWLPASMDERYDLRTTAERVGSEYYVEGHATYGHVRRFEVTTEESISVPR